MGDDFEPGDGEQPLEVVDSAGELDAVVVALRDFLHRSGAVRVAAVVDREEAAEPPALVDCARLQPIEISIAGRSVHLPHAARLDAHPPAAVGAIDVRQLPPFEVDAPAGEIAAPLGGLELYATAVRSLAGAFGGRTVAMATFETTDADAPLSITARPGDPIVLSLGAEEYEMDPGWP